MIEAVENHMPEVVMIDEIGTEAEALAARTIAQRGVQLIATAHGNELENVMKNPSLNDLVGGIASVTLGDEEAKRRGVQKSVLERESPPTFDVAVEMQSRQQWRVHLDVAAAVDAVLLGRDAGAEVRESDADGRVWAWPEDESTDTEDDESLASASASSIGGGNGAGVSRGRRQTQADRDSGYKVLTQGFPPEALAAARGEVWSPSGAEERATASQAAAAVARLKEGKKKGRTATATTPGTALKVFLYGIDPESVRSVAEALSMPQGIAIAERVQDADAVLATRARLKSSE